MKQEKISKSIKMATNNAQSKVPFRFGKVTVIVDIKYIIFNNMYFKYL